MNEAARVAFVANAESNTITLIDLVRLVTLGELPVGARPARLAFDSVTTRLFVTNFGSDTVSVIE